MLLECYVVGRITTDHVDDHWFCQGCGHAFALGMPYVEWLDRWSRTIYVIHVRDSCERHIFGGGVHGSSFYPSA